MTKHLLEIALLLLINSLATFSSPHSHPHPHPHAGRLRRSYEGGSKSNPSLGNNVMKTSGRSAVFATDNSTVVVAQIGGTASLPCAVRKFSNGVVSWIRKQDSPALLTVGLTTYSSDDRFMVEHTRHLQNWGLLIKHVQFSDAGVYECQVSTHPPTSILIKLKVTEASAEILGAPDLHVRSGSLLRLVCTVKQSTEPPSYMFWFHDERMINYDAGVQVKTQKATSVLLLNDIEKSQEGNYTCKPSNAIPASINVHVLNATEEENPAAMLHLNNATPLISSLTSTLTCQLIAIFIISSCVFS